MAQTAAEQRNSDGVERRLTGVETGLAAVNTRLDGLATREDVAKVNARLDDMAHRESMARLDAKLAKIMTRADLDWAVRTLIRWQIGTLLAIMGMILPMLAAVIAALFQIIQILAP